MDLSRTDSSAILALIPEIPGTALPYIHEPERKTPASSREHEHPRFNLGADASAAETQRRRFLPGYGHAFPLTATNRLIHRALCTVDVLSESLILSLSDTLILAGGRFHENRRTTSAWHHEVGAVHSPPRVVPGQHICGFRGKSSRDPKRGLKKRLE